MCANERLWSHNSIQKSYEGKCSVDGKTFVFYSIETKGVAGVTKTEENGPLAKLPTGFNVELRPTHSIIHNLASNVSGGSAPSLRRESSRSRARNTPCCAQGLTESVDTSRRYRALFIVQRRAARWVSNPKRYAKSRANQSAVQTPCKINFRFQARWFRKV
jgi:hypothetical protein